MISINEKAVKIVKKIITGKQDLEVNVYEVGGSTVIDCGVKSKGSVKAGLLVGEICMGGLAEINIFKNALFENNLFIKVQSENPVIACLGSQYAGWKIKLNDFYALGSGPARAISRVEKELYNKINYKDDYFKTVIFLETSMIPTPKVVKYISDACRVEAENTYIIVARTGSLVGSIQISSRVLETAIHRLMHSDFPLNRIVAGGGVCPVPPVAASDKYAMGVTNDAIIMMGEVTLTVEGLEDEFIKNRVESMVSTSSPGFGKPFIEILEEAAYDFYKISPSIFSPAKITIINRDSGHSFQAGWLNWDAYKKTISKYVP
ncbi:MAG: methenyltetrahydromethanopterin cyclohydrolase [Candidatus Odinarchaeota archaeon]